MIETMVRRGRFLTIRTKWFCPRPALVDSIRLVRYLQSSWTRPWPGFVREPFSTKLIDLSRGEDEIFARFGRSTQYKIRRAEREGLSCDFDMTTDEFVDFYNRVAETARWERMEPGLLESAGANRRLTAARDATGTLAAHSYLVDRSLARVRLWHSAAAQWRESTSERRNLVGRANRLLHFRDMLHFKQCAFAVYDFGGYATDVADPKKLAINRFKDGFGGRLVYESNFDSFALHAGMRFRRRLARPDLRDGADRQDGEASPGPAPLITINLEGDASRAGAGRSGPAGGAWRSYPMMTTGTREKGRTPLAS
jgi:hypothetical protein